MKRAVFIPVPERTEVQHLPRNVDIAICVVSLQHASVAASVLISEEYRQSVIVR